MTEAVRRRFGTLWTVVARRCLVLRQLRAVPAPMLCVVVAVLLARVTIPTGMALVTGDLVGALVSAAGRGDADAALVLPALGWLTLFLVAGQAIELTAEPLRFVVARHVDGTHRRAVERLACTPPTITRLEEPECQDDLSQAAGDPDDWTESTPGAAAWGQAYLLCRYVGGVVMTVLIAEDSPVTAVFLLAALTVFRSVQRHGFLTVVRAWVAGTAHRRRAAYWRSVLTGARSAKELRIFGFAGWVQDRYLADIDAHLRPFRAAKFSDARRQWICLAVVLLAVGSSVYVLGSLAAGGAISIGRLSTDLFAIAALLPLFAVSEAVNDVEGGLPRLLALDRLRSRLGGSSRPAQPVDGDAVPLVRFESVRYRYPGGDRPVLDGLDLEIRPHETLALVGLNGAGKTTLVKLLAALYQPDSGRITADGVDLSDLGADRWQRRMAVVFQDFLRYELPARDNIALGAGEPRGERDIRAAAEQAGIASLVDALPAGWDTPLSPGRDGGVDLSGGQWQRVALARGLLAVAAGAKVLVLDEPTAHLDVRAEFEVFHQVIRAARHVSVVLISHRLSTVREADRIALIDRGRIAECGSHEELMALDGGYAELFRLQARRFATGEAHR